MLKYLNKAGDEVHIFTPDCDLANAPSDFLGFRITTVRGFNFALYKQVTSTLLKVDLEDMFSKRFFGAYAVV